MSMNDKKMKDAMRIFEALSGVDEELLAKCEDATDKGTVISFKKSRPIRYYGKIMAACLCFVVMGALLRTAGPLISNTKSSETALNFSAIQEVDSAKDDAMAEEEKAEAVTDEISEVEMAEDGMGNAPAEGVPDLKQTQEAEMDTGKSGSQEQKNQENQMKGTQDDIEKADAAAQTEVSCPKNSVEKITLAEAKEETVLGEYVPGTVPAGYTFESASKSINEATGETESITLCWTKGMDDILIVISKATTEDMGIVDITKPETYDVHQYEIPYADTVPENYRSTFQDPVFAEKDFSLEIVKARMKVIADQGDTDTPRGEFTVLYDSGILVRFNGDSDAESIYEMFLSMK